LGCHALAFFTFGKFTVRAAVFGTVSAIAATSGSGSLVVTLLAGTHTPRPPDARATHNSAPLHALFFGSQSRRQVPLAAVIATHTRSPLQLS
jgi:hypothetical protein